jgi:hypothetical protein
MLLKDLLAAIEEIQKDLSYTQNLQERWEKEADRFPIIFEYIKKQSEFFKQQIEKLLSINVNGDAIPEFARRRGQAAQATVLESTASEAQPETAEKKPDEKESPEVIEPPIAQEERVRTPQSSSAATVASVSPTTPPSEEKEKVFTQKRSERKSGNRKSASRAKSRQHARKAK